MKAFKPGHPAKFRRILVPTDFSSHSNEAANFALPLLAKGGILRLVHVVKPIYLPVVSDPGSAVAVYDPVTTRHAMHRAQRHLKALSAHFRGIKVEISHTENQKPAESLAKEAKSFRADLVCMSTHGRSGISRLLFGSMAQKFLSLYQGPVMLYRPSAQRLRTP